jgi:hypothetical protein
MGIQITSGQDGLLAIIDVVLNRTVSFEYPDWPFAFDHDREQGIKTRRSVLERAASEKLLLSTYHLPFPGIGHVTKAGTGYRWVAADYQWQLTL